MWRCLTFRHQSLRQDLMRCEGDSGITCRHAAHWQRVWYMLVVVHLAEQPSSQAAPAPFGNVHPSRAQLAKLLDLASALNSRMP
jgi:hypothetical protein